MPTVPTVSRPALRRWVSQTVARAEALRERTPVVTGKYTDDDGYAVAVREGRVLWRLASRGPDGGVERESHQKAARRLSMNARTDLALARTADVTADCLASALEQERKASWVELGFTAAVGAVGDLAQGGLKLLTAAAYGAKALYHAARSRAP
jgi:hypothetical protein